MIDGYLSAFMEGSCHPLSEMVRCWHPWPLRPAESSCEHAEVCGHNLGGV